MTADVGVMGSPFNVYGTSCTLCREPDSNSTREGQVSTAPVITEHMSMRLCDGCAKGEHDEHQGASASGTISSTVLTQAEGSMQH